MKAQVISLPTLKNNSSNNKKKRWRYTDYNWDKIRRANQFEKPLCEKAVNILSNAIYKLQQAKVISYSHEYITQHFTKRKNDQNNRILSQLLEVLNINFRRVGFDEKGKKYYNRFEVTSNENTYKILENPDLFYKKNAGRTPQKVCVVTQQKCGENTAKMRSNSIYKEKQEEEEKTPLTGVSVFSSVHYVDRMDVDSESDFVSQPIHVATAVPTPKPRIRVQADSSKTSTIVHEQTDLLCYPDGAASQSCSTKNEYGEIVAKKDELVTNCHEFVGNSDKLNRSCQPETPETRRYEDSHSEIKTNPTVRGNRTTEPLQPTYSSRSGNSRNAKPKNLSSSKDVVSISELLAEMLDSGELFEESNQSTERQQLKPQSLTNQGLPLNEYLNKLNEPELKDKGERQIDPTLLGLTTPQTEEKTMKAYDWDNPANKLDLAISRNFDSATAQQLTCDIDYCYLEAESKLRLVFKKKLAISEDNKSRLKQLIRDVYGDNTEIVYTLQSVEKSDVAKITRTQEKFSKQPSKTQKHSSYSGNSYSNNQSKIPSYEERQKALKEFYVKQFAEWDKEIEEKKAKELELEKQKALEITKPEEIFSPLTIEIFAKRRAEREAKNPSKVNVEEEVKRALMLFEEEQKRKNIPQCEFVGLTESAERPLPHIKVPECWNVNKPKSEEV